MSRHRMRAAAVVVAIGLLQGCHGKSTPEAPGDPVRGRALLHDYGCGACHSIRGVDGARGNVGPPLEGIRRRVYLAGALPNGPETMARWIRTPYAFKPHTAMPTVGASERDAADMVAYLWRQ